MPYYKKSRAISGFDDDPLTQAMAPPPGEEPSEREARLRREEEAKKVSDSIDEELNRQRLAEKRGPKPVKLLLLGQSESGKSTTLKNFQLMNSPKAFRAEKASWRAIVQLNVVRSFRLILEAMNDAQAHNSPAATPYGSPSTTPSLVDEYPTLTSEHLKLKMRLSPLLQVEEVLLRKLSLLGSTTFEGSQKFPLTNLSYSERSRNKPNELSMNSTVPWKNAFTRLLTTARSSIESGIEIEWSDPNDIGAVLHACAEDMVQLWNDPTIKTLLSMQNLKLEEMAGFFLDDLDRVTAPRYVPTNDDILKARLKTLGVSEHRFLMKAGSTVSHDWRIFDVGGQRSLRAAWVPFFDDIDAIIFLAPVSCFDQVLAEDHAVNRLEDSVNLWKSVVSNPMLKNTDMVLFLNKCDILKTKLASGVRFADYILSYADRPSDFENVSQCTSTVSYDRLPRITACVDLRKKFSSIFKEKSPIPRHFYYHFTSVTDTKSTFYILTNVRDIVLRENLKRSALA